MSEFGEVLKVVSCCVFRKMSGLCCVIKIAGFHQGLREPGLVFVCGSKNGGNGRGSTGCSKNGFFVEIIRRL